MVQGRPIEGGLHILSARKSAYVRDPIRNRALAGLRHSSSHLSGRGLITALPNGGRCGDYRAVCSRRVPSLGQFVPISTEQVGHRLTYLHGLPRPSMPPKKPLSGAFFAEVLSPRG